MNRIELMSLLAILASLCSACIVGGFQLGQRAAERSAIRAGAAEWVQDETGNPVFQWKAR